MEPSFTENQLATIFADLSKSNLKFMSKYPGDSPERQPVQTLYGGAQLFKAETTQKISQLSQKHLSTFASDANELGRALSLPGDEKLWESVYQRVQEKLRVEAVEDFRIDFEDGYGNRPDTEEDETAVFTAKEVARGMREGLLPPFIGIRIKPFTEELKVRSARTLDIFVSTLVSETGGKLPQNFVVTLPKVTISDQVESLVKLLEILEVKHQLEEASLRLEIMIETPQAIINRKGECPLSKFLKEAKGRCRGAHFGTYDYTAGCDITAAHQKMDHPVCDFALNMMKVAYSGTGVWLSDGATSVMPVGESKEEVHAAWRLSYGHIMHSLSQGYYQGWDLHPGQLVVRYAATYSFFLEGLEQASARLKNFIEKAAQATLVGDVFDDAATGQGLLNYFLRALNSGAISEKEIELTGLSLEEIRSKSFVSILKGRTSSQN